MAEKKRKKRFVVEYDENQENIVREFKAKCMRQGLHVRGTVLNWMGKFVQGK